MYTNDMSNKYISCQLVDSASIPSWTNRWNYSYLLMDFDGQNAPVLNAQDVDHF